MTRSCTQEVVSNHGDELCVTGLFSGSAVFLIYHIFTFWQSGNIGGGGCQCEGIFPSLVRVE